MAYLECSTLDAQAAQASNATPPREGGAFRLAMRELASGVALITTEHGGERMGCTATSLCSLSLDPPSLIVCIDLKSSTLAALRAAKIFGVNILAADHEDCADRFAGRTGLKGTARFAGADWMTLVTGAPMLRDALASIDCVVEETLERHTHAIVIGRVLAVHRSDAAPALVHWRGQFATLGAG